MKRVWLWLGLLGVCGGACGGGGGAPADAPPVDPDAEIADAAVPDAEPDAEVPDAEVPDAEVPDAMPDAGGEACTAPPPAFTDGVSTLAGCDLAGAADGARGDARFSNPVNVALGPDGDVYVADFDNHRIRVVAPDGDVSTLVEQSGFERPFGLTFDADGTLYVSTDRNDLGQQSPQSGTIWRVDTTTGAATVVVRDVGKPRGIVALADGRIVLSDFLHHTVRLLDPDDGTITDLAGATDQADWVDAVGADARFNGPYGVDVLPDGRIVVADLFNHRIRAVALDGTVTTLAGTGVAGDDDGAAAAAQFDKPQDVAVDAAGNIYVADTDNYVIRKISPIDMVTTVIGTGVGGWLDHDDLLSAQVFGIEGLAVATTGATLWLADGTRGQDLPYHRVRVVDLDGP